MLIRTNIYLKDKTIKKLKKQAKEERTTVSSLIRKAIDERNNKNQKSIESLLSHVKKNSQKSKFNDLAKNHDKYLLS